jgi:hypothetical protein
MKNEIQQIKAFEGDKVTYIEINPSSGDLLIEFWSGRQLEVSTSVVKEPNEYIYSKLTVVGEDENRKRITYTD